jgi:cation diffusion facilitator family transporter
MVLYQAAERPRNRDAYAGKRVAAASLGLNVALTGAVFSLYLLSGSAAILAEAVHCLTDIIGSLLVLAGIYLSEKKSERFPWGLYKIENLAAVVVAGLIFLSAYEIAVMIYRPHHVEMRNLGVSLVAVLLLAPPVVIFSGYEKKKAREINSPSLAADAESWRMDVAPLAVVAAGIAGAMLSYPVMDRVAAFVVLLIVVRAGYGILKDSMKSLLDASVDRATLDEMKAAVEEFPEVKEIISLSARNSGRFIFVDAALTLSLKRLKDAHEISNRIEREIKGRIPFVERVIVHYEPELKDYRRYAAPLTAMDGEVSEHFGGSPYIAIWDERPADGAVVSMQTVQNPFSGSEKGKGLRLAEFLVGKGVDVLYTRESFEGKGPQYVLSDAGIEVRKTDMKTLKDLIGLKI